MATEAVPEESKLVALLADADAPLSQRMRAVFYLRGIGGAVAVDSLGRGVADKSEGALLRHELAYCLGQMRDAAALPVLESVLRDVDDDPIVRHECGEAIGAIGRPESLPLMEEFAKDGRPEVSETCALAAARLRWTMDGKSEDDSSADNPYQSVDPAPAEDKDDEDGKSDAPSRVEALRARLMDAELPLFQRYRAMFSLRNMQTTEAVLALTEGLFDPTSALFRHEVAYVLGQLQHSAATDALAKSLRDTEEHEMVRHEAAEALGAIGSTEALELLREYAEDPSRVVKESCVIALDAADYWATLGAEGAQERDAAESGAASGAGAGSGAGAAGGDPATAAKAQAAASASAAVTSAMASIVAAGDDSTGGAGAAAGLSHK